jgi:hypothetical protein
MAFPKVKLSDNSGNTVAVDTSGASNALNVKLSDSDNIDIGNVVLTSASGSNIWAETADTDSDPNLDARLLLGTHALLSARKDSSTTIGITALDGTHNALHVAISDGTEVASVDSNNALVIDVAAGGILESAVDGIETLLGAIDGDTSDLKSSIGTSGLTGPTKCLSIGGTRSGGSLRELLVDSAGHLQIDVLTTPHDITGGADGITTDDTTGQVLGGDVDCKKIDIQALTDNTGLIAVGFTGVDATEATGTGIILYAGDVYSLEISNLNLIYIESTVDTDGVRYTYFT